MRGTRCILRRARLSSPRQNRCLRCYSESRLSILDDLHARGMVAQTTGPKQLDDALRKRTTVYLGVDPTAPALHVGYLIPFMSLLRFYLHGHQVLALVGGATGRVGDPSGKLEERTLLAAQRVEQNVERLKKALKKLFTSAVSYASRRIQPRESDVQSLEVINNLDWIGSLNLLEFLTVVGKHARVQTMMNRDSVRIRMSSQMGISFTEFTYQLLQAYDFFHLHHTRGCTVQIGGSDQWGNILAGVDLIERKREYDVAHVRLNAAGDPATAAPEEARTPAAHGLTTPLLTTASGAKFGKSEGNAVWLEEEMTSVFDFYQFFLKTTDADVEMYLKSFTLLPLDKIKEVVDVHQSAPEKRVAQELLADEVTELVHGDSGLRRARTATRVLFGTSFLDLRADDIVSALTGDPRLVRCERGEIVGQAIPRLAGRFGLTSSGSEAHRLAIAKGLYLNNFPVQPKQVLQAEDLLDGRVAILRSGRDKHLILAAR